jgi:DUF4097 and DUF4098 domain-containing protein YvlB
VPADAVDIARRVATDPPVEREGLTFRLRPPSDPAARQAVTVSYQVQVPPDTRVQTKSDSGATLVRGVAGPVEVVAQSGAVDLSSLGGAVSVSTGSGAVRTEGIGGPVRVTTTSSSFTAKDLRSSLHVRTQSGAVDAALVGSGDVDVETGSSAVRLRGVRGGLIVKTQSGHVSVGGTPGASWVTTTGSSGVDLDIEETAFSLDAQSRSGSVTVDGHAVQGSVAKRQVNGTVKGGGPLVRVLSGSGSVRVRRIAE